MSDGDAVRYSAIYTYTVKPLEAQLQLRMMARHTEHSCGSTCFCFGLSAHCMSARALASATARLGPFALISLVILGPAAIVAPAALDLELPTHGAATRVLDGAVGGSRRGWHEGTRRRRHHLASKRDL